MFIIVYLNCYVHYIEFKLFYILNIKITHRRLYGTKCRYLWYCENVFVALAFFKPICSSQILKNKHIIMYREVLRL